LRRTSWRSRPLTIATGQTAPSRWRAGPPDGVSSAASGWSTIGESVPSKSRKTAMRRPRRIAATSSQAAIPSGTVESGRGAGRSATSRGSSATRVKPARRAVSAAAGAPATTAVVAGSASRRRAASSRAAGSTSPCASAVVSAWAPGATTAAGTPSSSRRCSSAAAGDPSSRTAGPASPAVAVAASPTARPPPRVTMMTARWRSRSMVVMASPPSSCVNSPPWSPSSARTGVPCRHGGRARCPRS
jgi:hypothetical protein